MATASWIDLQAPAQSNTLGRLPWVPSSAVWAPQTWWEVVGTIPSQGLGGAEWPLSLEACRPLVTETPLLLSTLEAASLPD